MIDNGSTSTNVALFVDLTLPNLAYLTVQMLSKIAPIGWLSKVLGSISCVQKSLFTLMLVAEIALAEVAGSIVINSQVHSYQMLCDPEILCNF